MLSTRRALVTLPAVTLAVLAMSCPQASADIALPLPVLGPVPLPTSLPLPLPTVPLVPAVSPSPTVTAPTPTTAPATAPVAPSKPQPQAAAPAKPAAEAPRTIHAESVRTASGNAALSALTLRQAPAIAAIPANAMAPTVAAPPAAQPSLVTPALAPTPPVTAFTSSSDGESDTPLAPAVIAGALIALAGAGNVLSRRSR